MPHCAQDHPTPKNDPAPMLAVPRESPWPTVILHRMIVVPLCKFWVLSSHMRMIREKAWELPGMVATTFSTLNTCSLFLFCVADIDQVRARHLPSLWLDVGDPTAGHADKTPAVADHSFHRWPLGWYFQPHVLFQILAYPQQGLDSRCPPPQLREAPCLLQNVAEGTPCDFQGQATARTQCWPGFLLGCSPSEPCAMLGEAQAQEGSGWWSQ